MVGSGTLMGCPDVDMDFWWRGRVEGPAEAAAEPAEGMLLTDISVRLAWKHSMENKTKQSRGSTVY